MSATRLLTIDEAAEVLRVTANRLTRLVRRGLVPHVTLPGGEVRFDVDDLTAWIERHKSGALATAEVVTR